jgi:hypothetical protein
MKIEPVRKYVPRDFALVTPGHRCLYVETKWGKQLFNGERDVNNALSKLSSFTCYVSAGLERLKSTTSARQWVLNTWRGKGVKMLHVPTGTTFTSLRGVLEGSDDAFRDLNETLTWLKGYGIPPSSISGMAWKLFRASINDNVQIGFDPAISEQSFYGGRQECGKPDTYNDMKLLDIHAAYPTAMAKRDVSLSLVKVDNSTNLDPEESGLARVRVYVPKNLPYPPLPVRVTPTAIQFQWGQIEGVWSWCELDAARQLGCKIEVLENYAPGRTTDLFSNWWSMAQEGRELNGAAGQLAKAIANSTWGQFAMRGTERSEISWADDKGDESIELDLPNRAMPHQWAMHIASEITSRVRVQTLTEGLYGTGKPVHVDTDGLIVSANSANPRNTGTGYGQWRVKEHIRTLDLKAPQLYRYQRQGDDLVSWNYVASGMTPVMARRFFDSNTIETNIAYLNLSDKCLPSASSDDELLLAAIHNEAMQLGVL